MGEPKPPQSQRPAPPPPGSPTQQYPTDPDDPCSKHPPRGQTPPPEKDPCDEPAPPGEPPASEKPPDAPPCPPPTDKPCAKKPCPGDPPKRPCPPDPCKEEDSPPPTEGPCDGEDEQPESTPPTDQEPPDSPDQQGDPAAAQTGDKVPSADPLKEKLERFKRDLKKRQDQVQDLEAAKTSVADLTQRIQGLEKTIDERSAAEVGYQDFYHSIEVFKSEIECFIQTVRCQLELTTKQKKCICDVIDTVDSQVRSAQSTSAAAAKALAAAEQAYQRATEDLAWQKQWYDFLKTGLQQQTSKQRDGLKALKQLADPAKDQCEAWFYLYELERLLGKSHRTEAPCWDPELWLGTFVDCWSFECYKAAYEKQIVIFNEAENAEKVSKTQLEQARKRATELDKAAKELEGKRRELIVKGMKQRPDCCGPKSKC
jgi:hypothetical protein